MAIINLRRYYPHYPKDKLIDVPDGVAAALEEGRRIEHQQANRQTYYHVYSIDCSPGIENHAMFLVLSPEELLIQDEDEAAAELVLMNLTVTLAQLSPHSSPEAPRSVCAEKEVSGDRRRRGNQ